MVNRALVCLHAHPDDEAIFTGGTILRAVQAGWRVVLVVATKGERGLHPASVTDLAAHRLQETLESAAILGVHRVVFLGYGDGGLGNGARLDPRAAARDVPLLAAAHRHELVATVRDLLLEEKASVLTSYDQIGVYGHPDHVAVHHLAARAVSGTPCELYEATVSRRALRHLRSDLVQRGLHQDRWPHSLADRLGVEPGPDLWAVDVSTDLGAKLSAVAAHSSQVVEAAEFMGLPPGAFHHLLGTEWFRSVRIGGSGFLGAIGASPEAALAHLAS